MEVHASLVGANKFDYQPYEMAMPPLVAATPQYPGLAQVSLAALFHSGASQAALTQLQNAVETSLSVGYDVALKPAEQRRLTDVQWQNVKGDDKGTVGLSQWEVTVPSSQLSPQQLDRVCRRTTSALRPARRHVHGHYAQIRQAAEVLAARVVALWQVAETANPPGLYFCGVQITYSPAGSERTRHVDPAPIAAALATFSLAGAATVTLDVCRDNLFSIQCDGTSVYTLTGEAVRDPVHHRVAVATDRPRLAVTLRFADAAMA